MDFMVLKASNSEKYKIITYFKVIYRKGYETLNKHLSNIKIMY